MNLTSYIVVLMAIILINYQARAEQMDNRIYFTSFLYFSKNGAEKVADFTLKAAKLFQRYDLHIERSFAPQKKGEIGSVKNDIEQPDLIQIFSLPDMASFQAYTSDEEHERVSTIRDDGLRKFTITVGKPHSLMYFTDDNSNVTKEQRTYALAYIQFKRNGESGLIEFNKHSTENGLFKEYGMHVEFAFTPVKTIAAIGSIDFKKPDMVMLFYLDDIRKMTDYLADSRYKKYAPLRDNGLQSYHFFMGKLIE